MHLPSRYGLGVKWRPSQNWTFVLDGVRINYTDLLDGLIPNVNVVTSVLEPSTGGPDFAVAYTVDDVTEIHVGGEYLFSGGKIPWALRAGAYTDPDNVIRDKVGGFGDALGGRDDEIHYTAGFGMVVNERFQADIAAIGLLDRDRRSRQPDPSFLMTK